MPPRLVAEPGGTGTSSCTAVSSSLPATASTSASGGGVCVADGIGKDRHEAIVHRATGGLRRLVVLGHTGSVTLDAIR